MKKIMGVSLHVSLHASVHAMYCTTSFIVLIGVGGLALMI